MKKRLQFMSMKKNPKLKKEHKNGKWIIGFDRWDIEICSEGKTEKEAIAKLWDYVYDLIPSLESESQKLALPARKQLEFLREHFQYTLV